MYVIGDIIYGSPVGDRAERWLGEHGSDNWEDLGLSVRYTGNDYRPPAFVGVVLGQIDEATDAVRLDFEGSRIFYGQTIDKAQPFSVKPTPEQVAEAQAQLDALPEGLREKMPPLAVYLVWSTS